MVLLPKEPLSNDPSAKGATPSAAAGRARCPICRKRFDLSRSPARPFCSERCRLVDLGRWLGEGYGLPHHGAADVEDEAD